MTTHTPNDRPGWQDAVDARLIARLMRPIERPGLVKIEQAHAIVARIEGMLSSPPLAQNLERRWRAVFADQADQPPIVYARPRGLAVVVGQLAAQDRPALAPQEAGDRFGAAPSRHGQDAADGSAAQPSFGASEPLTIARPVPPPGPVPEIDIAAPRAVPVVPPAAPGATPPESITLALAPGAMPPAGSAEPLTPASGATPHAAPHLVGTVPAAAPPATTLVQRSALASPAPTPALPRVVAARRATSSPLQARPAQVPQPPSLASRAQLHLAVAPAGEMAQTARATPLAWQADLRLVQVAAAPAAPEWPIVRPRVGLARVARPHSGVAGSAAGAPDEMGAPRDEAPPIVVREQPRAAPQPGRQPLPLAGAAPADRQRTYQRATAAAVAPRAAARPAPQPDAALAIARQLAPAVPPGDPPQLVEPAAAAGPARRAEVDIEAIVDKVERRFMRRLAIEGERRGGAR
jgi:hypothetical protein